MSSLFTGGQIITITGEGFNDTQGDSSIILLGISDNGTPQVPGIECPVTEWNSTSITCSSPSIQPGNYSIKVNLAPQGYAESSGPPFEVILRVSKHFNALTYYNYYTQELLLINETHPFRLRG